MKVQKNGRPPGSHNIDELFSSKLDRLEKHPSPAVWENISGKLNHSPFSTGGLIGSANKWLLFGLAGVIITVAVLFFSNRHSKTQQFANTHIILPDVIDTTTSPAFVAGASKSHTKTIISEKPTLQSVVVHSERPYELTNLIHSKQNPASRKTKKKTAMLPASIDPGTEKSGIERFQSKMVVNATDLQIPEPKMTVKTSDSGANELPPPITDSISPRYAGNIIPGLSDLPTQRIIPKSDSIKNNPTSLIPDTQKVLKASSLTIALEVYIEPSLTGQLLKARSSDAETLLDYRKRNENSFSGTNWGLEGRVSRKNLFLQMGIRYSAFGADAVYPFSSTLLDTSRSHFEVTSYNEWEHHTYWVWTENSGIVYYVPEHDSTLIQLYDSAWISLRDTSYNKRNEKSQLRYRYVEIPLLIGYQLGKGKLKTEFSGGIAVGFLSGMKGNIITSDLSSTIPASTDNFPYNKPLLNLLLRIGCSYNLNENWGIFTRSAFRYTPGSEFSANYPLYQRHYSIGLQFGLKYTF
jgi:hypothetical protein